MKISVTKTETFNEELETQFLKSYISSPILNKFEIPPFESLYAPEFSPSATKSTCYHAPITGIYDKSKTLNEVFDPDRAKFKDQRLKFEVSDIVSDFPTWSLDLYVLESTTHRRKRVIDSNIIQLEKFTVLEPIMTNHFSLFDKKLISNTIFDVPMVNQELIDSKDVIMFFRYSTTLDLGKSLKELNDSDVISDILRLEFEDHQIIKLKDMMYPKRWMPKNLCHFAPSVQKSRKELDLDVNWNYVNALKDIYGSGDSLQSEWVVSDTDNDSSIFKYNSSEEEIKILEAETHDSVSQEPVAIDLEKRLSIDTKFLVDRFMSKRGRSSSNLDQNQEMKKPKIQERQNPSNFFLQPEELEEVVELSCPEPDLRNAKKFKYIAKTQFFSRRELVSLLESKYAIELVERNLEDDDLSIDREDIIVDESTCIILQSIADLIFPILSSSIDSVKDTKIGQKMLSLSLRYSKIYILVSEVDLEKPDSRVLLSKIKIDPFTPPVMKSLLAFYQFSNALETWINVKVLMFFASKYSRIAGWIRSIGEKCASKYQNLSLHSWNSRSFIKETESPAERFLSAFPVINSFQAQIMLSQMSLREILSLSQSALVEKFHVWIPEKSLLIFFSMTHMKLELK